MDHNRRLICALDAFVRHRDAGGKSKKHVVPLVEFAAAELRARGMLSERIQTEVRVGKFFERTVDLAVMRGGDLELALLVMTQSGSFRNNLNNRRRDIIGDTINLRAACPNARVGIIYLLRANLQAMARGKNHLTPIEEICTFVNEIQTFPLTATTNMLDAAAVIAAERDTGNRIRIEPVPDVVSIEGRFFDRLIGIP